MKTTSLRFGLKLLTIARSATSLWANLLRCRQFHPALTQPGRHDQHSISATNVSRNWNLNSPKKWTETLWVEGNQSTVWPGVSRGSHSSGDQAQDLVITLYIAAKPGSSGPFEAGWRSEKIAPWHPICSKSILLPIDARTGLRTFRPGVGRSLPACKRGLATIAQWFPDQTVGQPNGVKFEDSKRAKPARERATKL